MVSITSCQDWDITTIEKIGNRMIGYHPIQYTLAKNNGSQCGYCSPGWVMALYSLLKTNKMTMLEIEKAFGSNICRCTGYRPILEAFKKFASDAPHTLEIPDIEDLKICDKTGKTCYMKNCEDSDWCFINKNELYNKVKHINLKDHRDWYRVEVLSDIFKIWQERGEKSYMLVNGNTGKGVIPILKYPEILIDISGLSELKGFYIDQNLVLRAGTTLTDTINIFAQVASHDNFKYLNILNEHLNLVAHIPVRNLGSIAGNLMLKHQNPKFQSDIYLLLETVGAQLVLIFGHGSRKTLSMHDFLIEDMTGKVIFYVLLPPLSKEHNVVTFKIMPRTQNAHAIVNAGFNYKLNDDNTVLDCRIVYGGLSPSFNRAFKAEQYLIGQPLFKNETLQSALKVLFIEVKVTEHLPEYPIEYRKQLALNLFYKGLLYLYSSDKLHYRYRSGAIKLHETRLLSKGLQEFTTDPKIWPLNQPIAKLDGLIQCAGESKYTEDLPSLPNEVFAAFVLTTVPLGRIESIDPSKALEECGVIAFYTASDIPGVNSFVLPNGSSFKNDEELLCNGEVKFYNQPLGIIVAETYEIAEKAANLVHVTYCNVREPIIDIKKAKNDPNRIQLVQSFKPTRTGTDIIKIITGETAIYSQYHFCMETLVCVTDITEEGLKIYAATQWASLIHGATARALNINQNRIDVYVRRVGGAYGIKISRVSQVAVASSLVSYKLNKPCRFILPLTTNMRSIGKRLPCSNNYEIAVNKDGVIQYLNHNLYSDNGYVVSEPLLNLGLDVYSNAYKNDTWSHKSYNAVTDTASNSWFRSPGTLEHVAMAETLMERIAYELNLDPLNVRLANLDTEKYSDLLEMLDTLKLKSEYEERKLKVDNFNSENRWKKRGLRFSFLRWTPKSRQYFDINLSVYSNDGTVSISHGGVEIGQGINTKAIQICAYLLKIPVEKVIIKPNDTFVAPNNIQTGGSTTSQNISIGVRKCCEQLLKRLEPVRIALHNPTWEELIRRAFQLEIDLQVHAFVNSTDAQNFDVYGITLAEVEIDVLTGESEIIRVDLIEDAGLSVSPELDVGQVEGAFIMGVGYWTSERLVYEPTSGELLTNRTWEYWVPQARDIPQDFRIYFRKGSFSNESIFGAKVTGEPATCMGIVVSFALRHAIAAARLETGISPTQWFQIDGSYSVDKVCLSCATTFEDFKFY
ncbi:unnamed protein product, partial [Brenthis ino]